ncbi:hypothetical protein RXV86_20730 [Alisedimentitalea sp. MJ-SS2]|uniref:hypothetical protein n=1 Tax=Aliisedimentitalea sp. MJ-SS2 TaxID=3049795 RepID=UPI0029134F56|nr:hypothetical protein [Alisedimentitalea sp. MJ-SS2]MDU8929819.1 hypothetical protein [Alisedimentitalea sp. MJ-SS2]
MQVTSAFFSEDPERLINAARRACSSPNEEFIRPRAGVAQCRLLMDPEATAAVILQFDGVIEDLPQLVISLSSARAGDGHVVSGCAFVKVPQRNGQVLRVVQEDRKIQLKLSQMLDAVGGKPVRDVPEEFAERCYSL